MKTLALALFLSTTAAAIASPFTCVTVGFTTYCTGDTSTTTTTCTQVGSVLFCS